MKRFLVVCFVLAIGIKDLRASNSGAQIAVGTGNFGFNSQIGYRFFDSKNYYKSLIGARLDFNFYGGNNIASWGRPVKISDINDVGFYYFKDSSTGEKVSRNDEHIKSFLYGAILDFYPFGNSFRLSGLRLSSGYYLGGIDYKITNTLTEENRRIYGGIVKGEMMTSNDFKLDTEGFYFGVGADVEIFYGWKMIVDIGMVPVEKRSMKYELLGLNQDISGYYNNNDLNSKHISIVKISLSYRF